MSRKQFTHLVVETLSLESAKRGVICIQGLSDKALGIVNDDAHAVMAVLCELNEELERRSELRRKWKTKTVRPINPQPDDYRE